MRTRAKRKNVVNDRAGCENVPRHILCSCNGVTLMLQWLKCNNTKNVTSHYRKLGDAV